MIAERRNMPTARPEVSSTGLRETYGLLLALNRPDIFLSEDLALRRPIRRTHPFDHAPTNAQLTMHSDRRQLRRSLPIGLFFAPEYVGQQ